MLLSTYLYVNFGMLDGNVKMRRNKKKCTKKLMCSFEEEFFCPIKSYAHKLCWKHILHKSLDVQQKPHMILPQCD